MSTEKNELKIPGPFYSDHLSRFYDTKVWSDYDFKTAQWAGRYVHVILTDDQFDELLDDAGFYAQGAGGLDSQYAGLVKSAQATVKHMNKYEKTRKQGDNMSKMTKAGSTLYIHDSGSVICAEHAGFELAGEIAHNPKSFEYWTALGTWVVAGARDYLAFKNGTGFDLACESCTDWSTL